MLSFIILFFPAALSVWIHEGLSKQELKPKTWGLLYITSTLLINLCCFIVMTNLLGGGDISVDSFGYISNGVAVSYLFLALPFAVLFGVVITFVKKNLQIEVEEPENDKA